MCKSQAEGGRRCQGHLRSAAGASIATLVAAVTPESPAEVVRRMAGYAATHPDTTPADRDEVDEFLTEQITWTEVCTSLTTKQRSTIVGRLREALGRLTVDRATLAAWRAAAAHAWSATRYRVGGLVLAAAVVAGAGGCGTPVSHAPDPVPSVSAIAVAPEVREYAADPIPSTQVPEDVAAFFGSEEKAASAYRVTLKAFMEGQMNDRLLRTSRGDAEPADFSIREHLTPEARVWFDGRLADAHERDRQGYADVTALAMYGHDFGDESLTPGCPSPRSRRRSPGPDGRRPRTASQQSPSSTQAPSEPHRPPGPRKCPLGPPRPH